MSTKLKSAFTTATLIGSTVAVAVAAVAVVTCVTLVSLGNEDGYGPDLFDADKAHSTDRGFPRQVRDVAQSSEVGKL